jgi:large subunit ribosomal protein L13
VPIEEERAVPTFTPKPADITRTWHVIDATDVVLGRLATQAAILLRGKHKPYYAPHIDTGDFVVIINASKIVMTGNKAEQSTVYHHSGFPGGLKKTSYASVLATRPERIIEKAIKGMVPHNTLGRQMLSKLKVYAGPEHPHAAQAPQAYTLHQVSQQPAR